MTITYYVVVAPDGTASLAQQRKQGTPLYGYRSMALARANAIRSGMPPDSMIEERHTDGSDDWAGRVMGCVGTRPRPTSEQAASGWGNPVA